MRSLHLPTSWATSTLGAIAQWGSGGTPSRSKPSFYGGPIFWFKTGELGPREIFKSEETITPDALNASSAKIFPKGSIALAMYGATIGKVSILGVEATTNQACAVAIPNRKITGTAFLYHYLRSQKEAFVAAGQGGAQPNISQAVVKAWPVPVPPIAEQHRIADKLDTVLTRVDTVNTRLARVAPLLKRFRQSVLAAATSGWLTEEWRLLNGVTDPQALTLGELIKVSSGDGLTAKEMKPEGGVPVYGGNGINGHHDQSNVSAPTIVIGRVGFYCGSVHLTPSIAWVTDNALRVKFDSAKLDRKYLYFALQGTDLRQNMSSTAQPVISGQKIYPLPFNRPTLPEQTEIVRRVETLFAFADRLEARLQSAQTAANRLTPSLLAKAFRGELVPQDPNDEPAGELLKRLTATLAQSSAPKRGRKRSA
jgi:type I restriction enzyme S subunit